MTERAPITLSRFVGADAGQWQITSIREFRGASLPSARFLAVDSDASAGTAAWTLRGAARKLYHSRDHGEPFDFLTWFEFAPDQEAAFDHMLARLRACAEWDYVDREVGIRLMRISA